VPYAGSLEHIGEIGGLESFRQPSGVDSEAVAGSVRGKDEEQNVAVAVHPFCLRLQCCGERFDGGIAASLRVEAYDHRIGFEAARDDFRCAGRLSAENALTAE
jgi:hypothetical protein